MAADLTMLKSCALAAVDAVAEDLHRISDSLWNKPELGLEEHHAHAVLSDYLESAGFHVERHWVLDTAFRATWGDGPGPHVAVLCEYDALPGIGHACGHNLIAEVGVAAGIAIKAALEKAGNTIGKVSVLGTPSEEGDGGKIFLAEAGAFHGVTCALMAHAWGTTTFSKPGILAFREVNVTYRGKASHAAGAPWDGVNALDAAVMAYNSISCLRQQLKPTWRIHGVFTNGGEKPNIIPEEASLSYYARAPTMGEVRQLKTKVDGCFQGAATATGCKVEIEWCTRPYENMINNATLCSLYERNAGQLGVNFAGAEAREAPTGSTDMGNVSHLVPSIHPMFYIGTDAMPHTREFATAAGDPKAQPYTLAQGKALAMTALDVLCNPDLVDTLRTELQQDLAKDQ